MRLFLISILSICLCNFTCSQNQETQAAKYADTYAHGIAAFHDAVDVAHAAGKIPDVEYQNILQDLLIANQGGLDINTTIRGIAAGTSSLQQLQTVVKGIQTALNDGTSRVKDPDTLAQLNALVASINLTLTSIVQVYGGN